MESAAHDAQSVPQVAEVLRLSWKCMSRSAGVSVPMRRLDRVVLSQPARPKTEEETHHAYFFSHALVPSSENVFFAQSLIK